MAATQGAISKRRKFVADGVFYAELNEFFQRELAEEGYSGVEVRVTPTVTDISTLPSYNYFLFPLFSYFLWCRNKIFEIGTVVWFEICETKKITVSNI